MPRHIRKGDTVFVRSGSDKGTTGKVMQVIPDTDRVIVEGVNVRKKNIKPSQANPQGGTVEKEMSIHISKVSPLASDGKPTRVRFEKRADGSKVRLAVRNGEQIGPELKKARK
ncbi:MAG: 50S ribosomal protein L24 [Phycisphaeraceae bacterium]|nr:50S ribosomal protein L24 [Phycisphaeraceae bacterium]